MEFDQLMRMRQSCRSYDPERKLSREQMMTILEAGRLAPSACNAQPYHFTVCAGSAACEVARSVQGLGMNGFAKDVSCFVVIYEEDYNVTARLGSAHKDQDYRSVDIGIATAQMVFAAQNMGIASCILGWFDEGRLQALLHTKRRIRLVLALGYAREGDPLRPKKRKNMSDLVDFLDA